MSQASFQKQQREKARRDRAAAKSARREERRSEARQETRPPSPSCDEAAVLGELAALHARFDDGSIAFEEFEMAKEQLTARLSIG
jgi:hypothetical protein